MGRALRKRKLEPEGELNSKGKILNAAEELFSQTGFDGVSLRQIAQAAAVDLGLIPYYFETKENLYRETLERRAEALNFDRLQRLDAARMEAEGAAPGVAAVITAYLLPVVERNLKGGPVWRNYTRLIAQASYSPAHDKVLSSLMDPTASHFISALRMALPKAPLDEIYWGFHFLKSALVMTLAETSRIELLSRGLCKSSDIKTAFTKLIPFVTAGFERLKVYEGGERSRAKTAARPAGSRPSKARSIRALPTRP